MMGRIAVCPVLSLCEDVSKCCRGAAGMTLRWSTGFTTFLPLLLLAASSNATIQNEGRFFYLEDMNVGLNALLCIMLTIIQCCRCPRS